MSSLTPPPWPVPAPLPALPAESFDELLALIAEKRPCLPVLSGSESQDFEPRWTYLSGRDLQQQVYSVAALLGQHLGVVPGDRVAWLGLNHPTQIVLLFALARLGAIFVPLNHRLSPDEWVAVMDDCTPSVLVCDESLQDPAQDMAGRCAWLPLVLPVQVLQVGERLPLPPPSETVQKALLNALQTPLLLVYTSGTTGKPKGAVHTQGNLLANMAIAAQVQGITPDDVVVTVLPLFHVGGLCIQTLPALSVGAQVLLFDRFDPGATLRCFETQRPTLTLQVPATLQALIAHPGWTETDLSSLRAVWAGSSLLPAQPVQAFHGRGIPVCNVYGSTETGPFSIALPPTHALSHDGSCGWPAPGVEVRLCSPQGTEVASGEVGEVWVRAPNVVTRYWPDQPTCDAEGFFHSGDLARQAPDGSHTVVGRSKDMIISGGENIYPAEIENLLIQHPWVAECAVVGMPDARWGETVVAVLVFTEAAAPDENWVQQLRAFLEGRLARYKWPRQWLQLPALPRTALGKVQKPELQRQISARPATTAWPGAPAPEPAGPSRS
ncbi:class I adenylate-forming enzyme family protein [Hydrogenophaga sp.]|uniref:class I adenylate-forming enzyme family protein n=1 Tax=Hydrogenophaga sp. TaxID=1904254 RepID=UPI00271A8EA8|nr:AMP-binding protein [Hydrogenophaga sp.]MDO8905072.1 AMP-binding protein [Hydrogenophaga sp.]